MFAMFAQQQNAGEEEGTFGSESGLVAGAARRRRRDLLCPPFSTRLSTPLALLQGYLANKKRPPPTQDIPTAGTQGDAFFYGRGTPTPVLDYYWRIQTSVVGTY